MFKIEDKAKVQLPEPLSINQHALNKHASTQFEYNQQIVEEKYPDGEEEPYAPYVEEEYQQKVESDFPRLQQEIQKEAYQS